MAAVISLGGSIMARAVEDGTLEAYRDVFEDLAHSTDTLVIVVGAGDLKRYIDAVDGFGVNEARKDLVGIAATKLHAHALAAVMDANTTIPERPEAVRELAQTHDVIVAGGFIPGQSTDAVAVQCAEILDADRLVLATTVDGVYDSNPAENPDAEKFERMRYDDLIELVVEHESSAGTYALIDILAAKMLQRSHIPTVVLDGREPEEIGRCLGNQHHGTIIGG